LRSIKYTAPAPGSSTQQILAWLYPPDGDQNSALVTGNLQKLTDWANKDKIDTAIRNAPWQNWVYATDPASENARQRAIQQLGIKVK
jgi:hypothetical protein